MGPILQFNSFCSSSFIVSKITFVNHLAEFVGNIHFYCLLFTVGMPSAAETPATVGMPSAVETPATADMKESGGRPTTEGTQIAWRQLIFKNWNNTGNSRVVSNSKDTSTSMDAITLPDTVGMSATVGTPTRAGKVAKKESQ
jgi:hypothetical protein